jgi:hypothetical protein
MNKARRHELKMLKYKKRLNQLRLKDGEGKFYAYRSHGAPCSCGMCSYLKYKRSDVKQQTLKELSYET